uniref:HDC11445 n=1 Tax=Drosophila melanogaster TaxID=7227 RepID=Q6IKU4_DROME|nr:TPA_inf: HDC11445 [Drosophila melanogaster]
MLQLRDEAVRTHQDICLLDFGYYHPTPAIHLNHSQSRTDTPRHNLQTSLPKLGTP